MKRLFWSFSQLLIFYLACIFVLASVEIGIEKGYVAGSIIWAITLLLFYVYLRRNGKYQPTPYGIYTINGTMSGIFFYIIAMFFTVVADIESLPTVLIIIVLALMTLVSVALGWVLDLGQHRLFRNSEGKIIWM